MTEAHLTSDGPVRSGWCERRSGKVKHADDARSDYQIDYARIVHAGSFRRLQGKTQILALGDDDFYRTRLTHSLEVAQVAEGIVQTLRMRPVSHPDLVPPPGLIGAIGLAHDLGHPPFGHGGELALNYCMRDAGGFEGNAQTLRILARLEGYSAGHGADLTRRTLLGILKYPVAQTAALNDAMQPSLKPCTSTIAVLDRVQCKPAKAYYDSEDDVVAWILEPFSDADRTRFVTTAPSLGAHAKTQHKSFDCSIMDVADDIAYGVHDLEDAIALGLIDEGRFRDYLPEEHCQTLIDALRLRPLGDDATRSPYESLALSLFGYPGERKRAIGRLVHHFISAVELVEDVQFSDPLLRVRATLPNAHRRLLDALQGLIVADVIESPRVQQLEFKGQRMVVAVVEALLSDPDLLLPTKVQTAYLSAQRNPRLICDYVAAMTDGALLKTYERLFSPRMGSIFDRL